jgi:flagellar basal-body rod protein FlgF
MGQILEIGGAMLSRSESAVEFAAHNIANVGTSAYKRRIGYDQILSGQADMQSLAMKQSMAVDFSSGKEIVTDNPYDLSIKGNAFFVVRGPDGISYTRSGQFHRDETGRLVNTQGQALQAVGGGDLTLTQAGFHLGADGSVVEEGQAVKRIALVDFQDRTALQPADGGGFTAAESLAQPADGASVRQGAIEGSNVTTGDEMVSMMAALRRAETGQRLVQVYDDLMGRALSAFGGTAG